jgi:2-succinyl-5-enolpyruvyl-6-hydroxy-3-cyclohexene-1-carboxylate synthase
MSVRYVNYIGVPPKGIKVFANRGTSGIDGCVSTAIGAALLTTEPVYLLIGDVAFLYDRNGLLIEDLPQNLKILILNNSGGNIFRIIEGPSTQQNVARLFETRHRFTAEYTALDSKISYDVVLTKEDFFEKSPTFIGSEKMSILEVLTSPVESAQAFKGLKRTLQDQFNRE